MTQKPSVEDQIEQTLGLEAEIEVSATSTTGGDPLVFAKAALHRWVDGVVGVVAAAGSGRVTLIHANGARSQIASPELAYLVTPPVRWDQPD
ncbi:hypothetical protein [Novosphingobium sp.]|uniref:hypothetical protein n=1 Tax=Novosphingobium sp. TaxID=1874826 RepID=UPI0025DDB125|nr:hypothetical protein [Novosphingobium sp.]